MNSTDNHLQENEKLDNDKPILYPVDTILIGYYVDMSPRWYKVVSESKCKVKAVRMRHAKTSSVEPIPSKQEYPPENGKRPIVTMTKKGDHLVWTGMQFTIRKED
jgi:hypothetical protein